jgi:hypothetical protein
MDRLPLKRRRMVIPKQIKSSDLPNVVIPNQASIDGSNHRWDVDEGMFAQHCHQGPRPVIGKIIKKSKVVQKSGKFIFIEFMYIENCFLFGLF